MAPKKKKGGMKSKIMWTIIIVACLGLLRQTSLLLLLGMLPTLVVKFIDTTDENIWFRTVCCFNLAGVYPYVIDLLLVHNNSMRAVQAQMTDSIMWLVIYGAATMGYVTLWFVPMATEFAMRIINKSRVERHTKKLKQLNEEWGVGGPSGDII